MASLGAPQNAPTVAKIAKGSLSPSAPSFVSRASSSTISSPPESTGGETTPADSPTASSPTAISTAEEVEHRAIQDAGKSDRGALMSAMGNEEAAAGQVRCLWCWCTGQQSQIGTLCVQFCVHSPSYCAAGLPVPCVVAPRRPREPISAFVLCHLNCSYLIPA